mmetsp:Transcript_1165/g.3614  ORF Transcript_1165/g.3614 Transcript_1165/m.3614 type:complete len:302 (-) Transcript_1165:301-1206(-)
MDSRASFSRRTSSSLLSSRNSCSRCCSTRTRRRRRSRSFRAMLPARFDSLILRRNRPASCSSSWALGMRDCRASTRSRALATCVVAARSRSGCNSERSLASPSESPPPPPPPSGREKPRPARPLSNAATPSLTSEAAAARVRSSLPVCFRAIELSNSMSCFSRSDFTCMFCRHMLMLMAFQSSLAVLFWCSRSFMLKRCISRCSVIRVCSSLSNSEARISWFCRSWSNLLVAFSIRACFTFRHVARSRCSKNRRSWPSNCSLGTRMPRVTPPPGGWPCAPLGCTPAASLASSSLSEAIFSW